MLPVDDELRLELGERLTRQNAAGVPMTDIAAPIATEDRTLAALTHLSGLSGYVVPLGGVIVPIVIWLVKKDSAVISSIARQAVLLNVVVFLVIITSAVLWLTLILIPLVILSWIALAIVAIALPVVGAIKASQGVYYRYPVVGSYPQ
jgi:uncharacterized protein